MFRIAFGSARARVAALFSPQKPIGFDDVRVMLKSQAKAGAARRLLAEWEQQTPSSLMDEFLWDSVYVEPEDVNRASELFQEIFERCWSVPNDVLSRVTVLLERARRELLWLYSPRSVQHDWHATLSRVVRRIHGWRYAFSLHTAQHARYRLLGRVPGDATNPTSALARLTPFARPA